MIKTSETFPFMVVCLKLFLVVNVLWGIAGKSYLIENDLIQ